MQDLFSVTDPEWTAYESHNPAYLLKVASDRIRNYLGWHLAPEITEVVDLPLGERGLVMLPSRHVTNVHSVAVAGHNVSSDDFWWSKEGWIELRSNYYGWPGKARVTFNHGYETIPADVREVAYELAKAGSSGGLPVGNSGPVSSLSSPGGYSVQFMNNARATVAVIPSSLSHDQAVRLANYRILGDF